MHALTTKSANVSDTTEFPTLIEKGTLQKGVMVLADKGYTYKANREYLAGHVLIVGTFAEKKSNSKATSQARQDENQQKVSPKHLNSNVQQSLKSYILPSPILPSCFCTC